MTTRLFAMRLALAGCITVSGLLGPPDLLAQQWDGGQFKAPRVPTDITRAPSSPRDGVAIQPGDPGFSHA